MTVSENMGALWGVAPLLLVSVLFTPLFYAAAIMNSPQWLHIIYGNIAAFLFSYLYKFTWHKLENRKPLHIMIGTASVVLFFTGLFVIIGSVKESGLLAWQAGQMLALAGGNLEGDALTTMPLGKQIVGLALLGGGVFMTSLLYWFAPAAVVLGSFDPLRAMRRSLAGGWINLSAVLLCGVILAILLFLAMLPFGLGLLLWLPVMFVSVYVAWQDVFGSGLPQRG